MTTRNLTMKLIGIPETIDESALKKIMAEAIEELTKKGIAPAKPAKVVLRNRHLRKDNRYPCRREVNALWKSAVVWPAGVPHAGCGRTFTTEKRRDIHEAGTGWNARAFPHGCLDAILPADLRDDR